MLAAIFLFLFFGGGVDVESFGTLMTHHVKDQIKIAIADDERRTLALKGFSKVSDDINDLNKQVSKDAGQFEKLIKNYDSKPEDFDRLLVSSMTRRQQQIDKMWDDRMAMLQHVQPDEWRAIMSGAKAEMKKEAAKKN